MDNKDTQSQPKTKKSKQILIEVTPAAHLLLRKKAKKTGASMKHLASEAIKNMN